MSILTTVITFQKKSGNLALRDSSLADVVLNVMLTTLDETVHSSLHLSEA